MIFNEAIKRYTDNAEYERTHGNLQGCLDFSQLAEWISELKQLREQTRWIPVVAHESDFSDAYIYESKMPEHRQKVLVTDYYDEVYATECTIECNDYYLPSGNTFGEKIKAWMPSPESYENKAESEE